MSVDLEIPLQGKTIVITRALEQQAEANELFGLAGAKVLDLPALVIGPPHEWNPLDDALQDLHHFHWLIFSSSNGVRAVNERLQRLGLSFSTLPDTLKIAVVGRKTARALESLGVEIDFVPPNFVADSLIEHFPQPGMGLRVLLPRVQSGGRTFLAEAFRKGGASVVEVPAYESSCPDSMPAITAQAFLNREVDAIAFTSGKTVIHSVQLLKKRYGLNWFKQLDTVKILSIGPQTSIKCEKYFQRVDQEAEPHDLEGLVDACIKVFKHSS